MILNPEPLYTIIPIVVCDGFPIILVEKINLPHSKSVGSYSNRGEDRNNGTALKGLCVWGGVGVGGGGTNMRI